MNFRIYLTDIVSGTSSNTEGLNLYIFIKNIIQDSDSQIDISFKGATPFSSSFLNSSFGALIDDFGFATLKSKVNFIELTKNQANTLRKYFTEFKSLKIS